MEAGGYVDCSTQCPSVLFDAIIRPCFVTNPTERPTFTVLAGILSSVNAFHTNSDQATSDENFPRHQRSSCVQSVEDSQNKTPTDVFDKTFYLPPKNSAFSSYFSQLRSSVSIKPV